VVGAWMRREPVHVLDELIGLRNERPFLTSADPLAVELGIFEAFEHSGGKRIAEGSDELQLVLESVVGCVVARKSGGGNFQAGKVEFAHRSVDALIGASQLYELVSAIAYAVRQSPTVQVFGKNAALALVVITQSEQA
jgi:hypothetical protein